jgi:alpha-tubulin suppressor-like RCC1 family protein
MREIFHEGLNNVIASNISSRVATGNSTAAAGDGFGGDYSIALKSDGTVVGWGIDPFGQDTPPAGLDGVTAIAAGYLGHFVALKGDGTVFGWGYGPPPTLGQPGLVDVVAIAAGAAWSVALERDGTIVVWGDTSDYFCGPIPAGNDFIAISAWGVNAVALRRDGTVATWGCEITPAPTGLNFVVAVAAGGLHALALKSDGTVVAWGNTPPPPAGLHNVVGIAAGLNVSYAIVGDEEGNYDGNHEHNDGSGGHPSPGDKNGHHH